MEKTHQSLKQFLIRNQLLSLALLLSLNGCAGIGPIPRWEGKLWAGHSEVGGITSAQNNEVISAVDPVFDNYLAMTYDDFSSFYATYVLGCKEWKKGVQMMPAEEAISRFSIAMTDIEREAMHYRLENANRNQ